MEFVKYIKESIKYILRSGPMIKSDVKAVEELYGLNQDELRSYCERKFIEIFRIAFDKSPFYYNLYSKAGITKNDIQKLSDIEKLPIITKDMVRHHSADILTVPKRKVFPANTSGTSGSPLTVFHDIKMIRRNQAYTVCSRRRSGFEFGQPLVSLRGHLGKNSLSMKVDVSNTLYLSSYNISDQTIYIFYKKIQKFNPIAIEGYPSSLYSLSLKLKEHGLSLRIPIAFTSSETLLSYQRELIEKILGTEIFDRYGLTESTIYLVENQNHDGYYEAPGYSINEYRADCIITTSLINSSFPLIRYKVNDVIRYETEDKTGTIVIKRIMGRNEDFVLCKDGSIIQRLDHIFKGVNHVKYGQLVQDESGVLHVRVVPDLGYNSTDKSLIYKQLEDRVGRNNLDFSVETIDESEIIYSGRDKFKFLINNYKKI